MSFKESWVWITGASTGIGKSIAIEFAKSGSNLILSSRNKEELEKVKASCVEAKSVHIVLLDLNQPETLEESWRKVQAITDKVDVLINNGGISQRDLAINTSMDTSRRIMEVNFFGTIQLTKYVLDGMKKRGKGHILVTSSVAGKLGTPLRSSYCASKHAIQGYFESLKYEMEPYGIGVNIICPGYIKTNISKNALIGNGSKHSKMDKNQENGMLPEKVAKIALKSIAKNKPEKYIGGKEILAIYLKRYTPGLLRKLIRKEFKDQI